MKVTSFKKFLLESPPVPEGMETDTPELRTILKQFQDFKKTGTHVNLSGVFFAIIDDFTNYLKHHLVELKYGVQIGKGTTRRVFKVPIGDPITKVTYNTVLKVPIIGMDSDSAGFQANESEAKLWEQCKDTSFARFLCPVIDTSKKDLFPKLKSLPMFALQMLYCEPAGEKDLSYKLNTNGLKAFKKFFGEISSKNPKYSNYEAYDFIFGMIKKRMGLEYLIDEGFDDFKKSFPIFLENVNRTPSNPNISIKASDDQLKNLQQFCNLIVQKQLDDYHSGNFGIMPNGNVVLIDYAM